uniref:Uncharacterized protein n=1 Tax=Bursaphelenchus xylophilus TaxID=6326 RepID=A0A1I7SDI2_BURXY
MGLSKEKPTHRTSDEKPESSGFDQPQPSTSDSSWLRGEPEDPEEEWRRASTAPQPSPVDFNHGQDAWQAPQRRLDQPEDEFSPDRLFRQPPPSVSTGAARAANSAASAAAAASRRFGAGSSESLDEFVDRLPTNSQGLPDLKSCFKGPHCFRALASAAAAAAAARQPLDQRPHFPRLDGSGNQVDELARFHDHNLPLDGMASLESLIGREFFVNSKRLGPPFLPTFLRVSGAASKLLGIRLSLDFLLATLLEMDTILITEP